MTEIVRDEKGRFPAGVSGNPSGRAPGKRNEITDISQDLELAVRRNIKAEDVSEIISTLIQRAKSGSIQAARLLLDKVLPSARTVSEDDNGMRAILIKIENATYGALEDKRRDIPAVQVIDNVTVQPSTTDDTTRQTI